MADVAALHVDDMTVAGAIDKSLDEGDKVLRHGKYSTFVQLM